MFRFCLNHYQNVEDLVELNVLKHIRWSGKLVLPPIILVLTVVFFQAFANFAMLEIPIPAFIASMVLLAYLGVISTGALVRMFPSVLE